MDFYYVDEKYNEFLQKYEKAHRGVTKVPNIRYSDRDKFAFGTVLSVNGLNYYVSVSSFDKKQEANILIRIPGDEKEVKGSLRFNYMIPVPNECNKRTNKIYSRNSFDGTCPVFTRRDNILSQCMAIYGVAFYSNADFGSNTILQST